MEKEPTTLWQNIKAWALIIFLFAVPLWCDSMTGPISDDFPAHKWQTGDIP
jgi:hypothetical protein